MSSNFRELLLHSNNYIPLAIALLPIFLFYAVRGYRHATSVSFPSIGVPSTGIFRLFRARKYYLQAGNDVIHEGYRKHPDKIFEVQTFSGRILVLPAKYVRELQSLPPTSCSLSHALSDFFLGYYTTMDIVLKGHFACDITKAHLTQNLGAPFLQELEYAFDVEMPPCDDWTPVVTYQLIRRLLDRASARIFVGENLCRNEKWLEISEGFATCVFRGSSIVKMFPSVLWPLLSVVHPDMRKIREYHRRGRQLLTPEIERRQRGEYDQKPDDLIQWLYDAGTGLDATPARIVNRQLAFSLASINSTTIHVCNVVYDLASRGQHYVDELRQEILDVQAEEKDNWTDKFGLSKLRKLDSFMKESQRLNPPESLSFKRKIFHDITFSDGTTIPGDSTVAVAATAISHDDANFENAKEFDGWRFHKERLKARNMNIQQFPTTNEKSLAFGHGKYACPGRFFASSVSKVMLAHFLLNYDIKLTEPGPRPANLYFADVCLPNPTLPLLYKRRSPKAV